MSTIPPRATAIIRAESAATGGAPSPSLPSAAAWRTWLGRIPG
jgi:hypothetical protein